MNFLFKTLIATAFIMSTSMTFARPTPIKHPPTTGLITHNLTNEDSNAFINGTIPSIYPTQRQSERTVPWPFVHLICKNYLVDNQCNATIVMSPKSNPVTIGSVSMDLETGEITPKQLRAHGYKVSVIGVGEVTLSYDIN